MARQWLLSRELFTSDDQGGKDGKATLLRRCGSGNGRPNFGHKDFAIATGLDGIIVHGRLKIAFLVQMLTDWIGDEGKLKKLACQHRGMDLPAVDMKCKGKVTNKYVTDGEHCVECEIWTENPEGRKTAPGTATLVLPSRGQ
jgi:hypothetical protein